MRIDSDKDTVEGVEGCPIAFHSTYLINYGGTTSFSVRASIGLSFSFLPLPLLPNALDGLYDYVFLITLPTFAAWREKSLVLSRIKLIGVFHSTSLEKLLEAFPFLQLQAGNFGRLPYF